MISNPRLGVGFADSMTIFVPGRAKAKGRPRMAVSKNGKPFVYADVRTRSVEAVIRDFGYQMREEKGWDGPWKGPVAIRVYFLHDKPAKWWPGKEPQRGDVDNYLKTLKDGLNGVVYVDDRQVNTYGRVWSVYSDYGPGTLVVLEFYPEVEPPVAEKKPRKKKEAAV